MVLIQHFFQIQVEKIDLLQIMQEVEIVKCD